MRVVPILEEMIRLLSTDKRAQDWKDALDDVLSGTASQIVTTLRGLDSKKFVRKYLQTRFFETGKAQKFFRYLCKFITQKLIITIIS